MAGMGGTRTLAVEANVGDKTFDRRWKLSPFLRRAQGDFSPRRLCPASVKDSSRVAPKPSPNDLLPVRCDLSAIDNHPVPFIYSQPQTLSGSSEGKAFAVLNPPMF